MSIFRTRGFDSLIGKELEVVGALKIKAGSTVVIEGQLLCTGISVVGEDRGNKDTTLRVSGKLLPCGPADHLLIDVHNVVITGEVKCDELVVDTLALKKGCVLRANEICYRQLIIETGAVVHGTMRHHDEPPAKSSPKLPAPSTDYAPG